MRRNELNLPRAVHPPHFEVELPLKNIVDRQFGAEPAKEKLEALDMGQFAAGRRQERLVAILNIDRAPTAER
jgi:hypothetical protein